MSAEESPELGPPPRRVTPTSMAWYLWFCTLGVLPGIVALALGMEMSQDLLPAYRLSRQGAAVAGTINTVGPQSNGEPGVTVGYTFTDASGTTWRAEYSEYGDHYLPYRAYVGRPITVTYWRRDPRVDRPWRFTMQEAHHEYTSWAEVDIAVVIAPVLFLGVLMSWSLRRHRYLARWGELTQGTVGELRQKRAQHSRLYIVEYSFTDRTGRRCYGKGCIPHDLWSQLATGAALPVLYDRRNPNSSAPVAGLRYVPR